MNNHRFSDSESLHDSFRLAAHEVKSTLDALENVFHAAFENPDRKDNYQSLFKKGENENFRNCF